MTDDASSSVAWSDAAAVHFVGSNEPRSPAARSGEHRLMLAILEDAIALYVKSLSQRAITRDEAREARTWLTSRDCSSPFTFESICDVLGIDTEYIRRGMRIVRARPAEAAARLSVRHHGRSSGPATPPPALRDLAQRVAATDVAPAEPATLVQRAG